MRSAAAPWPAAPVAPASRPLGVVRNVTEPEWSAYVQHHPDATVDHLWGWRSVFTDVFGQECTYLAARRGDEVVGVLPLVRFRSRLFGRSVVSLPYLNYGGVLTSDSDAAAALVEEAARVGREFGASHVELRHRGRRVPELPARQHKVGMSLPLPQTADELWTGIDRKIRNQVRKAQKESLATAAGGLELVDEFYAVFAQNMRDLGTPVYSFRLFVQTLRTFPDRAQVHLVRHQGRAVAGSITVRFRDTVLVPWASALRQYRHLCPNMLLYWSMLERSIEQGARVFDFGRSSNGSGTHQFKGQWGATESPQHWEYVLLTRAETPNHGADNSRFDAAVAAWRRLPVWLTKMLGPHIVSNIP